MERSAYRRYTREDDLCQTNGHFSLNLREGSLDVIDEMLQLDDASSETLEVAWVGCGDGRELLSIASRHPSATFWGYDVNAAALAVAARVLRAMDLRNVQLEHADFTTVRRAFTHVYSTALAGAPLYEHLFDCCTRRICVLDKMWRADRSRATQRRTVRLSGSGEQRQLWCGAS
jgi:hypothetical protein